MINVQYFLVISSLLFSIGLAIVILKRNAILILMGIELMLNASNINLVAFGRYDEKMNGQMMAMFVMVVAAAEVAVALAIIVKLYEYFKNIDLDEINHLKK